MARTVTRRWARSRRSGAADRTPHLPRGYLDVDPRTARRVALWQELSATNPLFPGDPPFTARPVRTLAEDGYRLEHITSLGSHTGTHISVPAHFVDGGAYLSDLDESWTLMPLAVLDVRARVRTDGGDFSITPADLRTWEHRHGHVPEDGCLLLLTGFSTWFTPRTGPEPADDYFDPAPGFTAEAVTWLFDHRRIRAIGSDTFGPDASRDRDLTATAAALTRGGITVENVGPGLARMRPYGDWVSINGARPHFSGFQVGITGFTLP